MYGVCVRPLVHAQSLVWNHGMRGDAEINQSINRKFIVRPLQYNESEGALR